ncbi:MAG TPA: thiazole synthase [Planctomycetota bacterium]|nr:thiazole synthase [Planctomycetota bacterium]
MPAVADRPLVIAGRTFRSRLFLGTGKYRSFEEMRACHEASGTEMVTVAVRRVDFARASGPNVLDFVDASKIALLPNTAGCFTADDAIRTARLGREALGTHWVKLEVLGDPDLLLPEPLGTVEATRALTREGFACLVYCSDDPLLARRLADEGAAAVMPAGSPIGSGRGVLNPLNVRFIRERVAVPTVVDAGVGTASDVALAMELGVDAVLLNTAVAGADEPVRMARAMKLACEAGREAFLAGRIPRRDHGAPSSPVEGGLGTAAAKAGAP